MCCFCIQTSNLNGLKICPLDLMVYRTLFYFSACSCYPPGTLSAGVLSCDPVSGSCPCLPHVEGRQCDKCEVGYWNIDSGTGTEKNRQ